jgi:hypothetical protein
MVYIQAKEQATIFPSSYTYNIRLLQRLNIYHNTTYRYTTPQFVNERRKQNTPHSRHHQANIYHIITAYTSNIICHECVIYIYASSLPPSLRPSVPPPSSSIRRTITSETPAPGRSRGTRRRAGWSSGGAPGPAERPR